MTGAMVYAPRPGMDEEFDRIWESVRTASNDDWSDPVYEPARRVAEELRVPVEEGARELLARQMVRVGGRTFKGVAAGPALEEPFANPEPVTAALRIPERPTEPYWWDPPEQAADLEWFILTRRALGTAFHGYLLISGPAGNGKTQGVGQAVRRLNEREGLSLHLTRMDCATTTDPGKWFGRREVDKTGTHYVESDFIVAAREGHVILLDDFNRLHPQIVNPLLPAFDGSQSIHLSDLNVTVPVHPDTVFVATVNEGTQYGGTHRMDWAMRDRAAFTLARPFPPRDEEIRVVVSHTGCDADAAANMVDVAIRTRQMFEAGDLRAQVSTRQLVAAGWAVAGGRSERRALEITALPAFDGDANGIAGGESDRTKVAGILEGKGLR